MAFATTCLQNGIIPSISAVVYPMFSEYCVYKGQQYAQGQTWEDGCDYTCECVDAHIGQYKCNEK